MIQIIQAESALIQYKTSLIIRNCSIAEGDPPNTVVRTHMKSFASTLIDTINADDGMALALADNHLVATDADLVTADLLTADVVADAKMAAADAHLLTQVGLVFDANTTNRVFEIAM